ncbi:MAG TPA: UDP-N-acetylglucosamine 1-carboxyvinyltransferase, partial [Clostridia bacterium]|nr:UDP-N-acetylglucosamine 1-carboxyvinyltransferase [Clostridia bacterium]
MDLEVLRIHGGKRLAGHVTVGGGKNAALAIMPAALLASGPSYIENVPMIEDVKVMASILTQLGARVEFDGKGGVLIDPSGLCSYTAQYDTVGKLRASCYLMGVLLSKFDKAEV